MQRDDTLEIVGKVGAPFGLALAERLVLATVGCGQVIDTGQQRPKEFAIIDNAAHRNAAEAYAMIAAFAADEARARALAADIVERKRNLERRVDGLGAGIAEEHVIEIAGCKHGDPACQLEGFRMRKLKSRRIVERFRLGAN